MIETGFAFETSSRVFGASLNGFQGIESLVFGDVVQILPQDYHRSLKMTNKRPIIGSVCIAWNQNLCHEGYRRKKERRKERERKSRDDLALYILLLC